MVWLASAAFLLWGCGDGDVGVPWAGTPTPTPDTSSPAPLELGARAAAESATFTWTAVADATTYTLYLLDGPGATPTQYSEVHPQSGFTLTLTSLAPGTTYSAVVTATTESGEGPPSGEVHVAPWGTGFDGLGPSPLSSWAESGNAGSNYGSAIASGDFDDDGIDDLLIGARHFTTATDREGRIYLHVGSPSGPSMAPIWSIDGEGVHDDLGYSVAAGDVNGDGIDDLIATAPNKDFGTVGTDQGGAYAWHGAAGGPGTVADWEANGDEADRAKFGDRIAVVGDVNDDGRDDVVVGAPGTSIGLPDEGAIYLYLGSANGLNTAYTWRILGEQVNAELGEAITGGDFNDDGYDDIAVGVEDADANGLTDNGAVAVYNGGAGGPDTTSDWAFAGVDDADNFGEWVATGDVDNDGFDDLLVGAEGVNGQGRCYLFLGSAGGLSNAPDWTMDAEAATADLGQFTSLADVNGDGFDDVILTASRMDVGGGNFGRVYAYLGSANGPANAPIWVQDGTSSPATGDMYVRAIGLGDIDGDGSDDLAIAAPANDVGGAVEAGEAFFFFGAPQIGPSAGIGTVSGATVQLTEAAVTDLAAAGSQTTCTVTWGDGNEDVIDPCDSTALQAAQHTYAPGAYFLRVRVDNAYGIFGDAVRIVDVK